MAGDPPDVRWPGFAGREYRFFIHPLPVGRFGPGQKGVFILAREQGDDWAAVYIGDGFFDEAIPQALATPCVKRAKPTHVHVWPLAREAARRAIVDDLLREHTEAVEPNGCNPKPAD